MARHLLLPLALSTALLAAVAQETPSRGLVGESSLLGRVRSLEGQLEGELTRPAGDAAGASPQWWADEKQLTAALANAEGRYHANLQLRSENQPLREFLQRGSSEQNMLYVDALFIPTFNCPAEYRLGSWVDGGKWVCMSHYGALKPRGQAAVLSIGCHGETSFEAAVFAELGVRSVGVDFSLKPDEVASVKALGYINLLTVGLTGTADAASYNETFPDAQWVTIFDLLRMANQTYVDVFKIDCESCEYAVLKDLTQKYTRATVPFGQIQMEMHTVGKWPSRTHDAISGLEDLGYRLFHSEINRFNDKDPLVYHYEVAFIHESLVRPRT